MKTLRMIRAIACVWILFIGVAYAANDPTVYITRTGKKYHSAGCSYLRKSSIPIRLSEATNGYTPCSRCNPPRNNVSGATKETVASPIEKNTQANSEVTSNSEAASAKGSSTLKDNEGTTHGSIKGDKREAISSSSYQTGTPVGATATGKTIYEGPRGGRYHYSASGKKVYERRK